MIPIASGDSSCLDLLPPEVQCLILKQVPDIKTLHALIRASPRYLQVYRESKPAILSDVAWNHITPAVMPVAIDALEQRRHRGPRRDRRAVLAFLRDFRSGPFKKSHGFSLETSKTLLQFHGVVEYFMSDFTVSRLAIVKNYLHPEDPQPSPDESTSIEAGTEKAFVLSKTEYSRLARAFYYLELYGHLFLTPKLRQDDITVAEQSNMFLQRLGDWELEELLCVRNYLKERLTDYLNQVEDDFMQAFVEDEPHVIEPNGPDSRWENDDMFFSDVAHGQWQEDWLEGCLTRGLKTLKAMLSENTPEGRFDALGETGSPRNVLSEALAAMPVYQYRPRHIWVELSGHAVEFHEDIEKCNEAWLWSMRGRGHPRSSTDYVKNEVLEGLRRWGYVIWDHDRLQRLGILTRKAYEVSRGCERIFPDRRSTPSVERRTRIQEEIWQRKGLISAEPQCPDGWRIVPGFSLDP